MTQMLPTSAMKIEVADDTAKGAFIAALVEGKGPHEAARTAGAQLIGLYLARCADGDFSDLWHLAELARRDEIIHSTLSKAMAATGRRLTGRLFEASQIDPMWRGRAEAMAVQRDTLQRLYGR